MARIAQETLENIRSHVDIVNVISNYIPLSKKGRSFKCVCPFHDDHDPSMSVSQDKQIYHCFVCGAGGNVFGFVQQYENISYVEAVVKVAQMAGIEIDVDVNSASAKQEDPHLSALHKVCQESIEFCSYELDSSEGKDCKQYLHGRGLSDAIIKKFQLGYNPKGNKLYNFLHAKKYSDADIVDANLAWLSEKGIFDVFRHRIMVPIHDSNGKAVGFSARRVDESQDAKYVNTSETSIYVKGHLLYNYHRAKAAARKAGAIIVVEGAMDVLGFEKAGIEHSVATLGTACTQQQLRLLRYLGVNVILCYDGDKAGKNATYKFYQSAKKESLQVEIMDNKFGLDPDEIIEAYGKEELVAMSKKSISWIEFLFTYLKDKYDLNNYSEKKEYAKEIGKEIAALKDTFEKDSYYTRLKQITQFDMSVEDVAPIVRKQTPRTQVQLVQQPRSGSMNAQLQILSQMLSSKQACEYYRSELGYMLDETCDALALYIIDYYREHETMEVAELLTRIGEENIRKILLQLANWDLVTTTYQEVVIVDAVSKLKECILEENIRVLREQTNIIHDPLEQAKIMGQIIELKRKQGGHRHG